MAGSIEHLHTLRDAGLDPAQAEAIIRVLEAQDERVATKADLAALETSLTVRMLTFGLAFAGVILAGVYFLLSHFKP